jgi:hypothetical protein
LYLSWELAEKPQQLAVENRLFFDRFEDQNNIVNITVDGTLESAFSRKEHSLHQLQFN